MTRVVWPRRRLRQRDSPGGAPSSASPGQAAPELDAPQGSARQRAWLDVVGIAARAISMAISDLRHSRRWQGRQGLPVSRDELTGDRGLRGPDTAGPASFRTSGCYIDCTTRVSRFSSQRAPVARAMFDEVSDFSLDGNRDASRRDCGGSPRAGGCWQRVASSVVTARGRARDVTSIARGRGLPVCRKNAC